MSFLFAVIVITLLASHQSASQPITDRAEIESPDRFDALEATVWRLDAERKEWQEERRQFQGELLELQKARKDWEAVKRQWTREREAYRAERATLEAAEREWATERILLQSQMVKLQEKVKILENVVAGDSHSFQQTFDASVSAESPLSLQGVRESSHSVVARADDIGGWEPVVSQMSQRVAEMSAELQVLKTSHAADVETLQSAHASEVQAREAVNAQLSQAIEESKGSLFVRWGNSLCPNATDLVYSGVVGGSLTDSYSGSATNYLCLSLSPVLTTLTPSDATRAFVYGAEYETYERHDDEDALCAVCRSHLSTTFMLPGTNVCQPGWTLQYSGYLMASNPSHPGGAEYVCVDPTFDVRIGSEADQPAIHFHFTTAICGSLPCPPYQNERVVTCAVCSK